MNNLLHNKVAIITGANRGIGKSIVETFAENGATIIACVRTLNSDTESWMKSVEERFNVPVTPVLVDLSDDESVKDLVKKIILIWKL